MKNWLLENDILENYPYINLNGDNSKQKNGGIPLAYKDGKVYVAGDEGHTLVIGATGSKKSRLVGMPTVVSLLKAGENIIVTDPKAEIYKTTYNLAKEENYEIIKLNFRDFKNSDAWNPLENLKISVTNNDIEGIKKNVMSIANTFTFIKSPRDPYWEYASKEFTKLVLYYCVLTNNVSFSFFIKSFDKISKNFLDYANSNPNNEYEYNIIHTNLTDFINNVSDTSRENAKSKIQKKIRNIIFYEFNELFQRYLRLAERTLSCIIAEVSSCLCQFSISESFLQKTKRSDFKYSDIVNKKIIIFLIIPEESAIFEILIKSFIEESYSYIISYIQQHHDARAPRRINYVIDEFANIPAITNIERDISISRSRNIRFFLIVQNITQLMQLYGVYNTETIIGNCNNIVYLYSNDNNTNSFIHSKVSEYISLKGLQKLSRDDGEALFLLGREGEYIGSLKDISDVMKLLNKREVNVNYG